MAASNIVQANYEMRIAAPVDKVFPLACPVEEYKWIPGWKCDLVHCPNERVEQGTVFDEYSSAPFLAGKAWAKTTWTAVLHEPNRHRVHYAIKNVACDSLYKIEFSAPGSAESLAHLNFRYSASGRLGRNVIRRRGEAKIELMLQILATMLRHYCESGKPVPRDRIARLIATSQALTVADRARVLINTVAMAAKQDPLRQRYLTELGAGLR
jgi:hypothetical protein